MKSEEKNKDNVRSVGEGSKEKRREEEGRG